MRSYSSRIERGPMAADRFTQISNALFRDPRITYKAKGIFGLISTHEDGFGLTVASIERSGKEGRDALRTALAELEDCGYLKRQQQRDANVADRDAAALLSAAAADWAVSCR